MPLAVNGPDEERNLLAVCEPCNQRKGNSLPVLEFHEAIRRRVHSRLEQELEHELDSTDWRAF